MKSRNSSIDFGLPLKSSCESHVSVYYEQKQEKEPLAGLRPKYSRSSDEKFYENPPVEINDEDTTNIELPPLTWHGYENSPKLLTVTNTGRTILINCHWTNIRPYIEGGPLNGTYLFSQIHFHCPSEHEINGKRFPLEMHIVHYKTSYLTQEKAMQEKDGTVVLVYLFQLTNTSETVVSQITKLGCQLKEVNSRTESTTIPLNKLITPFFSNYYIYWGSLKTKKNKYLLQWIINCSVLGVTQQEVEDLSNIITCAIGLTVKQTPQLKPEFDAIYHVGEADYNLPPLKTPLSASVCTVCKRYEVPYVSCSCKLEKVGSAKTNIDGSPSIQLVCDCKSKTQVREINCKKLADKYICCRCRSVEGSSCNKCYKGQEGLLLRKIFQSNQIKPRMKAKLCCDVEEDGSDGGVVLKCKNRSLLMAYYKNIKKKQKRVKKKKSRKPKKSSDYESDKSSSKSSVAEDKSKDNLDSGAESGESEVEHKRKKSRPTKDKKRRPKSAEKHKVKKKSSKSAGEHKVKKKSSESAEENKVKKKSSESAGEHKVKKKSSESAEENKVKKKSSESASEHKVKKKSSESASEHKVKKKSSESAEENKVKKKSPEGVEEHKFKKKSSESVEEDKTKKKKKKKVEVRESIVSLKKDPSKPSLKTLTVLPHLGTSSSGLISYSPDYYVNDSEGTKREKKVSYSSNSSVNTDRTEEEDKELISPTSSADDVYETEKNKKIGNAETPEAKITQTCEVIEEPVRVVQEMESKSSVGKENKEANSLKDESLKSPMSSRSAKLRSRTRINVQKTKGSESSERKNLAVRKSKSKSPVSLVLPKNKASMKKESERSEDPESKAVTSITSKNKMTKSKTVSESAKSAQEVKCSVDKSIPGIEDFKSDIAPLKDTQTRSNKLRKKSAEEAKGTNKADSEEQKSKQEYDIKTIFEKKTDGKKAQSLAGDCNDVKVNFLLSPGTSIKSDPSCALITSESDLVEEKKTSEDSKEGVDHFSQEFTVNTAIIAGSEFPPDELKKYLKGCLVMEHTFRREHKEKVDDWSSEEYKLAIMNDRYILQEYRGKFHPQELRLGDCEEFKLIPKYPEPENFNFHLQDCFVKKEALDQICIRVKFLLKDLSILPVFENRENRHNETPEKKEKLLFDQQTQCSFKDLNLVSSCVSKSVKQSKNDEKILDLQSREILLNDLESEEKEKQQLPNEEEQKQELPNEEEQKQELPNEEEQKQELPNEEEQKQQSPNEEEQKQQPKNKSIHWEIEIAELQKCTYKPQNVSDVYPPGASQFTVTEQFSTDSSKKENKTETERSEKKLKSLFIKRRKTVYFMYDKVEKDESTGKKVFVGSFKTKEEVDSLKKQKALLQEYEVVSANEKSEETCDGKCFVPFGNKKTDLKVTIFEESLVLKSSSSAKNYPSTSQNTSDRSKDLITLHKYKPKHSSPNRYKRDCKNVSPSKVTENLLRNNENCKSLTSAHKGKTPKTSVHELHEPSEPQKMNPDLDGGKIEKKSNARNVVRNKSRDNYSQTEVKALQKSRKAEEDSARDNCQKFVDKKESQAALILIPINAKSLSKTEVILIEQIDKLKKDKEKDKNNV